MNWPRAAAKTREILTDAFATNLRRHRRPASGEGGTAVPPQLALNPLSDLPAVGPARDRGYIPQPAAFRRVDTREHKAAIQHHPVPHARGRAVAGARVGDLMPVGHASRRRRVSICGYPDGPFVTGRAPGGAGIHRALNNGSAMSPRTHLLCRKIHFYESYGSALARILVSIRSSSACDAR